MELLNALLAALPEGKVQQVCIGLHWTAVVVEIDGVRRCGLASTLRSDQDHHSQPDVPPAGKLETLSGLELAAHVRAEMPTLVSVGVAAMNALLPLQSQYQSDQNAEEIIAALGAGRRVALVGHFPFIERLRARVGRLDVLEQDPRPGDLPAEAASQIIPAADVVAITSMTLMNHTLEGLLGLCPPEARVLLLGPSTPLSPVLFDHGVDLLSGSLVEDIDGVLRAVRQGANFRQTHRAGVHLVNMVRPGLKWSPP